MSKNDSKSYGSQVPRIPHLSKPGSEIADLREDVDKGFINAEARLNFPELDWLDGNLLVAGGDIVLKGRNLLQGKTCDSVAVQKAGAGKITLTVLTPGDTGLSVVVTTGVGELVAISGKVLTLTVIVGVSTANSITTLINTLGEDTYGKIFAVETTPGAFDAAISSTKFAGGGGEYDGFAIKVAGVACLPKHQASPWTDTQVDVTVPALAGKAADDSLAIELVCDGVQCKALTVDGGGGSTATAAIAAMDAAYKAADTGIKKRTSWPELDFIDGGAFAAAGGTVILKGRNFLGSKAFDSLVLNTGTTSELTFYMMKPGDSEYTLEILDTGALSVALATKKVTININAGATTAAEIATEFNKAGGTMKGVMRCVDDEVAGAGTPAAAAEAPLIGGTGNYAEEAVTVGGVDCLPLHATGTAPAATWADTQISVTVPALTGSGMAASDIAGVVVKASNLHSQQLAVVLT